ncbi:MAG: alpha/beta hydrolase [Acidobacteria bacterium]|nr:alpha/beta hydrolase [Acidobacteriota bacterium]
MTKWLFGLPVVAAAAALFLSLGLAFGEDKCIQIMVQDPALDDLVDPPGYRTAPLGTLGAVKQVGTGAQPVILIPGLGFGGEVFDELMDRWKGRYRMYAVTLPGFGGTAAPPSPASSVSFGDQTWTDGALQAIEELVKRERIERPIVVGHWLTGTQLALRYAMKHPEATRAVIVLAGSARFVPTDTTYLPAYPPLAQRVAAQDRYMGPKWFKTVTRETWDDNNFLPGDYAVNPVRGLRLWRQAARPPLHVWVRYLLEFYSQDVALELDKLASPTLIVEPGVENRTDDPRNNYMYAFTHASWEGTRPSSSRLRFVTIPESRACLWFDQPDKLDSAVGEFLGGNP